MPYKVFAKFIRLIGIAVGLYFGVWLFFIGGLNDLINFVKLIKLGSTNWMMLFIGLFKVYIAKFIGTTAYEMFYDLSKALTRKRRK